MKVTDGAGGDAGLLFGLENPADPGIDWSCMKLRSQGLWVFNHADYQEEDGLLIDMAIPGFTFSGEKVRLKLSADTEGTLSFYVEDMETPVLTKRYPRYRGGYVGFTTYCAAAEFTDISFTDTTPSSGGEETDRPVRITCAGDSITQGIGSSNEAVHSYPAQLQKLLGDGYLVKNAGVSGTNVTRGKGYPYWGTARFTEGKTFAPDIVLLMIGTNDALNHHVWDPENPEESNRKFEQDYTALIEEYQSLPSQPDIYVVLPMVSYQQDGRQANLERYILPTLQKIAAAKELPVIDMNTFTTGHSDWFGDGLHPTDEAYKMIAREFARYIQEGSDDDEPPVSNEKPAGPESEEESWSENPPTGEGRFPALPYLVPAAGVCAAALFFKIRSKA